MIYQLKRKQLINTDLDNLWNFISNPANLSKITPKYMSFEILTKDLTKEIYPGMIIVYRVKPILNIPMNWMTEITHVSPQKFFVDEQRVGPYKIWHHEHILEEKNNGILMSDIVTYCPPLSFIGPVINKLILSKKLNDIFDYREKVMNQIFNSPKT